MQMTNGKKKEIMSKTTKKETGSMAKPLPKRGERTAKNKAKK
jgi:hypothetical protein